MAAAAVTDTSLQRKLTAAQALRRDLKDAFCERCGFEPANRSQAIAHAARCGSIVALREEVVPGDDGHGWRTRDGRERTDEPQVAVTDALVAIAEDDLAGEFIECGKD